MEICPGPASDVWRNGQRQQCTGSARVCSWNFGLIRLIPCTVESAGELQQPLIRIRRLRQRASHLPASSSILRFSTCHRYPMHRICCPAHSMLYWTTYTMTKSWTSEGCKSLVQHTDTDRSMSPWYLWSPSGHQKVGCDTVFIAGGKSSLFLSALKVYQHFVRRKVDSCGFLDSKVKPWLPIDIERNNLIHLAASHTHLWPKLVCC